jgi:hypothetical protein
LLHPIAGNGWQQQPDTRDKRGTEWLDPLIIAEAGQPAPDERTDRGTARDQQQAYRIQRRRK